MAFPLGALKKPRSESYHSSWGVSRWLVSRFSPALRPPPRKNDLPMEPVGELMLLGFMLGCGVEGAWGVHLKTCPLVGFQELLEQL